MIRTLICILVYFCLFCAASIKVKFKDGLVVELHGWADYFKTKETRR